MDFHPGLRALYRGESKFGVKTMSVLRGQHPPAQPLQVRMAYDTFHQPLGETPSAIRRKNENVGEISEGCEVRDDAGKSHLLMAMVDAERNGVLNRSPDRFERDACCPIRIGQKPIHHAYVDTRGISADFIITL